MALLRLRDQALGTSAATFHHLEYEGRKLGHVLDPRTGWPAEGVAQASAVAPTAAEADALATAFYIRGVGLDPGLLCRPSGRRGRPATEGQRTPVFLGIACDTGLTAINLVSPQR